MVSVIPWQVRASTMPCSGRARRKNGSSQVTYNRWPLYLYIGDGRGQVTGQAEDMGSWYLLSTSGAIDRQPITGPDEIDWHACSSPKTPGAGAAREQRIAASRASPESGAERRRRAGHLRAGGWGLPVSDLHR